MKINTYQSIVTKIAEKNDLLETLQSEILSLTNKMIESDEKKRPGILTNRVSLLEENQALLDEIELLKAQKRSAYLKPFEDQLNQALSNNKDLQNQLREMNKVLDKLLVEKRICDNTAYHNLNNEEWTKNFHELEMNITQQAFEINILARDYEKSKFSVNRCKMELEQAREEVETWK